MPWIAELNLPDRVRSAEDRSASFGQGSRGAMLRAPWQRLAACEFGFTLRSKRAEGEEGSCRDERIPRLRRIKQRAAQKHHTRLALQLLHERLRRVRRDNFMNQRAHYGSAGGLLAHAELAGKPPGRGSLRLIRQSSQVDSSN